MRTSSSLRAVGASGAVAAEIGPALKPGAILSDVGGSVKAAVVEQMAPHVPAHAHLVPAHPVAGTEFSGPDAGFASLFENRWCIVTPVADADPAAVERLSALWSGMGANVETMSPQHHDLVLAITSHLPHLIAYNIVGTAADIEQDADLRGHQVLGRRLPRLHAHRGVRSDHVARRVPLQSRGGAGDARPLHGGPHALQRAIRYGDGQTLFDHFTRTRAIRRSIIEQGQETAAPDFGRHLVAAKK